MQRLFSTFANGWPGKGLLLQRVITAAVLFHCAFEHTENGVPSASILVLKIIAFGAGILLLVGLWTPVAGAIVAVAEPLIVISHSGDPTIAAVVATLGLTLAMIGPGAWSIDARLFGRKHLKIPA